MGHEVRSTPEQERHSDFAAGRYIVWDDELGVDEQSRYMVESTCLDFLPDRVTVFGASVSYQGDGLLAAEKLVASDGRRFVLVRLATREEEEQAGFRSDDDDEDEDDEDLEEK